MTLTPPSDYGSTGHLLPNEVTGCKSCRLSTGNAVRGCTSGGLSKIKLIVVSDHTGAYEEIHAYPFWDNHEKRQPYKRKDGSARLLQWANAGGFLRAVLEERAQSPALGLDSYRDVYMTNAVKCNPKQHTILDKDLLTCTQQWLKSELYSLHKLNPNLPILIAGGKAFKSLRMLDKRFEERTTTDFRNHRREIGLRFWETHPVIVTCNPARVCSTQPRTVLNSRVIELSPLPGSPIWQFQQDLMLLKQLI